MFDDLEITTWALVVFLHCFVDEDLLFGVATRISAVGGTIAVESFADKRLEQ